MSIAIRASTGERVTQKSSSVLVMRVAGKFRTTQTSDDATAHRRTDKPRRDLTVASDGTTTSIGSVGWKSRRIIHAAVAPANAAPFGSR